MRTLARLRVPAHWGLISFCFVVAAVAILFEGIATHTVGVSGVGAPEAGGAQAPLAKSRPILSAQGSRLASTQPSPGRRIALTFDDGPDPHWTPKIARVDDFLRTPSDGGVIISAALIVRVYADLNKEMRSWS